MKGRSIVRSSALGKFPWGEIFPLDPTRTRGYPHNGEIFGVRVGLKKGEIRTRVGGGRRGKGKKEGEKAKEGERGGGERGGWPRMTLTDFPPGGNISPGGNYYPGPRGGKGREHQL